MSYTWIKQHLSDLDDYRIAQLSDRLWRRRSELNLVAARAGLNGCLPPLQQVAFWLHLSPADLERDLADLQTAGLLQHTPDGWLVIEYAAQQAPAPTAERVKAHRARKKQPVTPDETEKHTEVEVEVEVDSEVEVDIDSDSEVEVEAEVARHTPVTAAAANSESKPASNSREKSAWLALQAYGIGSTDLTRALIKEPYVTAEYIHQIANTLGDRLNPGLLIHAIRSQDKPPTGAPSTPARNTARLDPGSPEFRRRYVEGEYSDLVTH